MQNLSTLLHTGVSENTIPKFEELVKELRWYLMLMQQQSSPMAGTHQSGEFPIGVA